MDPRCASSLSPRAKEAFRGFYRYSAFQFPGSIADYEIDTSFEQANPPIAVRAIADSRSKEPSIFARARARAKRRISPAGFKRERICLPALSAGRGRNVTECKAPATRFSEISYLHWPERSAASAFSPSRAESRRLNTEVSRLALSSDLDRNRDLDFPRLELDRSNPALIAAIFPARQRAARDSSKRLMGAFPVFRALCISSFSLPY